VTWSQVVTETSLGGFFNATFFNTITHSGMSIANGTYAVEGTKTLNGCLESIPFFQHLFDIETTRLRRELTGTTGCTVIREATNTADETISITNNIFAASAKILPVAVDGVNIQGESVAECPDYDPSATNATFRREEFLEFPGASFSLISVSLQKVYMQIPSSSINRCGVAVRGLSWVDIGTISTTLVDV
jgi:hypothetical protein